MKKCILNTQRGVAKGVRGQPAVAAYRNFSCKGAQKNMLYVKKMHARLFVYCVEEGTRL